jgi:hypothetical protein
MHSPAGGVQPDRPNDNYSLAVSDLASLIEHIQASMKMLEGGYRQRIAAQRSGSRQQCHCAG